MEEIADRAVVLRDGRNAGELARNEINRDRMVRMMVGRDLKEMFKLLQATETTKEIMIGLRLRGYVRRDIRISRSHSM